MSKKVLVVLAFVLCAVILAGCGGSSEESSTTEPSSEMTASETLKETSETTEKVVSESDVKDPSSSGENQAQVASVSDPSASDPTKPMEIKEMIFVSYFIDTEIDDNNEIKEEIAKKTGVRLKERFVSDNPLNDVENMMQNNTLPDLIDAGSATQMLYENNKLVPWDDYLANSAYSNLRGMYSDKQWELFRQEDGHIYWASPNRSKGESKEKIHNDCAFWIQVRVLEWAHYPKIETLDEYFDLLEKYYAENKENADGTKIIPYTAMATGWRDYCLESPPQFLAGYPNDGTVIVNAKDENHPVVEDYNDSPTAKRYLQKLNEAFGKGLIDPDFFDMDIDQYIGKLSSGAVLGFFDAWWNFSGVVNDTFETNGFDKLGYNYVPLALTIDKGMTNHYHSYEKTFSSNNGIAVTTSCSDPDLAFSFLNRCLDEDIHNLRFWGVEGVDYEIDDQGLFYRTDEMRLNWLDPYYQYKHVCRYKYLPQYYGTSDDGKNALHPEEQYSEFFLTLSEPLRKCFAAYEYTSYVDFLHSEVCDNGIWYPMYTHSSTLISGTPPGDAFFRIRDCKLEWLPKIVMCKDFEAGWAEDLEAYKKCKPSAFLTEMQMELDRRASI